MDNKDLGFENYKEVEKEKKGLSEIPTFFISAAIIAVALLLLPLFTTFKGMDKTNNAYNVVKFFSILGFVLIIAMAIIEILIPLRYYLRFAKRRGDKNGIVYATIGVCVFAIFVCAFMLLLGFLLIF